MRDKSGCLNCHFLCHTFIGRDGWETDPLTENIRTFGEFSTRLKRLDPRMYLIKCFHGKWDADKIGIKNTIEIESTIFRRDRGKKCPLFSIYDSTATLDAVEKGNKRKEDVIDRRITRIMAWIAIGISIVALILPYILPRR